MFESSGRYEGLSDSLVQVVSAKRVALPILPFRCSLFAIDTSTIFVSANNQASRNIQFINVVVVKRVYLLFKQNQPQIDHRRSSKWISQTIARPLAVYLEATAIGAHRAQVSMHKHFITPYFTHQQSRASVQARMLAPSVVLAKLCERSDGPCRSKR